MTAPQAFLGAGGAGIVTSPVRCTDLADVCTREHPARHASPILDSQRKSERRTANAYACRKDPVSIIAPTTTQQEFVRAIDTRDVATQVQIALEATRERMLGDGFNLLDIPD